MTCSEATFFFLSDLEIVAILNEKQKKIKIDKTYFKLSMCPILKSVV